MSRRVKITAFFIVVVVFFGGLVAFNLVRSYFIAKFIKDFRPPPSTISSSTATAVNYQPSLYSVGSVVAINGVTLSPELAGVVEKINFESGEMAAQGQSLVQMDTDLDEQDLKSNLAKLQLDKLDFERKKRLYHTGAISVSDYDLASSSLIQTQAMVDRDQVTIAKKNIKAPFAGKLGIRQVNLGQYLNPGDAIVTLQQIDPLFVNFNLPQQYLPKLYMGQKVGVTSDLFPGEIFYGQVTAINAQVTKDTRNIEVQATVPNSNQKLYPGIFADVNVYLPQQQNVVVVPQTAVSYSLYGDVVYVLTPTKEQDKTTKQPIYTVKELYIKTGQQIGNNVVIKSGIKAGDLVVNSGQLKLQDGASVIINNAVKLDAIPAVKLDGGQ